MQKYAAVLGLRAILSDHGQNDAPEKNGEAIFENYRTVIRQARADLGYPGLAVVVNRQTPYRRERQVRAAQERVIREIPNCFPGPDYDGLADEDRPDGIHLGTTGLAKAAQLWREAVSPDFLKTAPPFVPNRID